MSGETAGGFFSRLFFSPLVCARFCTWFCGFAARSSALSTNKLSATHCCVGFQSQAKGQSILLRTKKTTLHACILCSQASFLGNCNQKVRENLWYEENSLRCSRPTYRIQCGYSYKQAGQRKTDLRLFLLSRSSWPTKRYLEETSALYAGYIFTYIQVRKYKNPDISAQAIPILCSTECKISKFYIS